MMRNQALVKLEKSENIDELTQKAIEYALQEKKPKKSLLRYYWDVSKWWDKITDSEGSGLYGAIFLGAFVAGIMGFVFGNNIVGLLGSIIFGLSGLNWTLQAIGFAVKDGLNYKKEFKQLVADKRKMPELVEGYLKQAISEHRKQVAGSQSPVGTLEVRLENAFNETTNLNKYWKDRIEKSDSQSAKSNFESVQALTKRLHDARESLDRQKEALVKFFDGCEEQIVPIKQQLEDMAANWRLRKLEKDVEDITEEAGQMAIQLTSSFFKRIGQLQAVLENLEKESLLEQEMSIEELDEVGQRIIEVEESNIEKIKKLQAQFLPFKIS